MTAVGNRGVCIVAPPDRGRPGSEPWEYCTPAQREWVGSVRRQAEERGYQVSVFRTVPRTSRRRDEANRRLLLVDPWEADRLYRLLHRSSVAVFQAGRARVLLDPLKEVSTANSIALARLVRYKSYFAQFDGSTPPANLFLEFDKWAGKTHVEGQRDCRVLPLHMFAPRRDWPGLTPMSGRREFEQVHGKPAHLSDEDSRAWKQPSALHGKESLVVANFALQAGFHWDVSAARTRSRIASLVERWKFEPGSYANVSPDGHIRGGQRSGVSASREGQAPRPAEPESVRPSKKAQRRRPRGK